MSDTGLLACYLFWYPTFWLFLQLLSQSRLANMVHESKQILPALFPKAGLYMAQEGQVLLPGVRLGEQVLKSLPQGQQDLPVVYWLVSKYSGCTIT